MRTESADYERLFFAIWPPDSVREQMTQRLDTLGELKNRGRRVATGNLHLTLHFLGNWSVQQIPCLIQQAECVSFEPFELRLTRFGYFAKPRVIWMGCDTLPAPLARLHQQLGQALMGCGFRAEARAYNPHVTMLRKIKAQHIDQEINPVSWQVDSFVLVKSITHSDGVEYQVRNIFTS
jgi:RNA 2',3'-cyclic 3'-phosphodiesterase